jgi:long-chain fatty acid transport protein
LVSPGGLSKRWNGHGAWFAQEFSLQTVEMNPTAAYRLSDKLAVGGGVRMVYSRGKVKSRISSPFVPPAQQVFRDLDGDSFDFGYNLAVHFAPSEAWRLAATYRSRVDLTVEGNARLGNALGAIYNGAASVEVPLPAALSLATAFEVTPDTTFEIVYERTYWSAYDELDFDYDVDNPLGGVFDQSIPKDWEDSNTIRLGLTHRLDDRWTLMAGFAIDESPAPKRTIGYELPESDGKIYSIGARYRVDDQWELAGGVLYTKRDELRIRASDDNDLGLVGEFDGAGALLVTLGARYDFD